MKFQSLLTVLLFSFAFSACNQSKLEILQNADILAEKGKYQEAINQCNKVLLRDSKAQLAYLQRGIYFTNMKQYSLALEDFDRIISLNSQGSVYFQVNRESPVASEEDKLTVYIEEVLFQRGVTEYLADKLNSSLNDLNFCLEKNYKKSKCYLWIGSIYVRKGQKEEGCKMYTNAIELGDDEAASLKEKNCK